MAVLDNVAYILKRVPAAAENSNLLFLLYWQLFDKINIPPELMKKMEKATSPETIARYKRMLLGEK